MQTKRNFLFLFYLLAGIVAGAVLTTVCDGVPFLRWLAFGGSIGLSPDAPFVLDLAVFKLTFGFSLSISVVQILTIGLAIFLYNKTKIR